MTSTKEGKSDESSSGEDEESLRELVSFQHAREILYKCCVCGQALCGILL